MEDKLSSFGEEAANDQMIFVLNLLSSNTIFFIASTCTYITHIFSSLDCVE